jgi:predicted GIY-YIG superfamily endonuclease
VRIIRRINENKDAFRREKQIQNWSRKKKEALINEGGKSSLKKATKESNKKQKG